MASVRDIHNFGDQFTNQLQKLGEAVEEKRIDPRDEEAIREFIPYQDTQRGLAASTNVNNCSDLRLSAERADTPLDGAEQDAWVVEELSRSFVSDGYSRIVLGGFEPPSRAPEALMIGHYTTGLRRR
jgi:hypothetical protein